MDSASLARRTAGFSGAELANLVNEAALAAGKGGHARITSSMLDEAQDKILMGSERRQAAAYIASHPSQSFARGPGMCKSTCTLCSIFPCDIAGQGAELPVTDQKW